jgi:hypothetical protein
LSGLFVHITSFVKLEASKQFICYAVLIRFEPSYPLDRLNQEGYNEDARNSLVHICLSALPITFLSRNMPEL